jgi:hypothetical protein
MRRAGVRHCEQVAFSVVLTACTVILSEVRSMAVILQRLEAELDELWSFVGKKANRQWVWIAMDAATRQVIAFYVGIAARPALNTYGLTCQLCIGNRRCATRTTISSTKA